MKISRLSIHLFVFILALFFFLSSCNFIIILPPPTEEWEKVEEYKVEPGINPSQLIQKFVDSTVYNSHQNYVVVTYDPGCPATYHNITFTNKLYFDTRQQFNWLAVTAEDTLYENKVRKKLGYSASFRYQYPVFYKVKGLKSSLRNLYHNNNIPDSDLTPMTFFIASDTIRRITRGAINNEERYLEHKNFLDSLSQNLF
jgi:hypothetical protein